MPRTEFGQFLRKAREKSGKTQKKLATEMGGIVQATISAWERGRQLPPPRTLPAIARGYGVDLAELQDLFDRAKTIRPTMFSWQSTAECFLKAQWRYFDQNIPGHIDVWVLGSGILQLLSLPAMRDSWRDNLRKGMNYHVVWIFDILFPAEHCYHPNSHDRYLYFLRVMGEIGEIIRDNENSLVGQVHHYPVVLNMVDCDASMIKRYNEWKADDIPGNVFHGIEELPFSSVGPIVGCCGDESATIIYVPSTILFLPLAMRMSEVIGPPYSPTPASQTRDLFTFLNADQATRLGIAISDFRKSFGASSEEE